MPPATVLISPRRLRPAFICLSFLASASHAQDNSAPGEIALSRWLNKEIIIDGKTNEWSAGDFINDEKAGFNYIVANDTSGLYVCLVIKDEIVKTKILNGGFSLFLNNEGKKKRSYEIDYPLRDEENSLANNAEKLRDIKSLQVISFLHARTYRLTGFKKGEGEYNIDLPNDAGIKISLGVTDSGAILYETAIPFSAFLKKQPALQTNENSIAICFSVNALTKPTNIPAATGPTTGNTLSPGRRFTNNNIPNAPPSQSFGQMEKLFENSKTWKIVSLAKSS